MEVSCCGLTAEACFLCGGDAVCGWKEGKPPSVGGNYRDEGSFAGLVVAPRGLQERKPSIRCPAAMQNLSVAPL